MSVNKNKLVTQQMLWKKLGTIDATVASADVILSAGERLFQTVKDLDNVVYWEIPPEQSTNGVLVLFACSSNAATADISVYLGRKSHKNATNDCDLIPIGTLDVNFADQLLELGVASAFAPDEINVTDYGILPDFSALGSEAGSNRACLVLLSHLRGFNTLVFQGYGTVDTDLEVYVTGY